ncbi:hypothetical protein AAC387_Pa01g3069 [Persea americana]
MSWGGRREFPHEAKTRLQSRLLRSQNPNSIQRRKRSELSKSTTVSKRKITPPSFSLLLLLLNLSFRSRQNLF